MHICNYYAIQKVSSVEKHKELDSYLCNFKTHKSKFISSHRKMALFTVRQSKNAFFQA